MRSKGRKAKKGKTNPKVQRDEAGYPPNPAPPMADRGTAAPSSSPPITSTTGSGGAAPEYDPTQLYWETLHRPPSIHVKMDKQLVDQFLKAYSDDTSFRNRWEDPASHPDSWFPGKRFMRDHQDLLYFLDADFQPRLCVPQAVRPTILKEAHDSPFGSAHASPEKLWQLLSQKFYWPRMRVDINRFCESCDTCQKTKPSNFNRFGFLIPNPIPHRPYQSISMDLIVNLPWSGEYNAIFVVVDRLSKHAQFLPTTTGLTSKGFTYMFVRNVACRFGLPDSIITDRDPRWTSDFWNAVTKFIKTKMSLSSSHHPQHDGQTEIVNKKLETMLRAYVASDRSDWAEWLHILEFAYNSTPHASTGVAPYLLLYGFNPKGPLDFLSGDSVTTSYSLDAKADNFLKAIQGHRENARLAIARSQVKQVESYNKGRRPVEFAVGSKVLVNPHSLEWIESKADRVKLVQRWIGLFEVTEVVSPKTYRLRMSDKYPGSPLFSIDHLKAYHESPTEFGERQTLPETRSHRPASEEYEVDTIVGHRYNHSRKRYEYLVRWLGYSPLHDTWQTERDLRNARILLSDYRSKNDL